MLYRAAVAAVLSGRFLLGETLLEFAFAATVGIAVGLTVAGLAKQILKVTKDSFTEIAITLLAPYIAWVVAEQIQASGVLACVAGGLYVRRYFSTIVAPMTRIQARAVWESPRLPAQWCDLYPHRAATQHASECGRAGSYDLSHPRRDGRERHRNPGASVLGADRRSRIEGRQSESAEARSHAAWSHLFIVGWTGMRGIVTLAGALALPLTTAAGAPFPFREEIILISFGVILATLVLQGLSLTPLIRALHLDADQSQEGEERQARVRAAEAALTRLDGLAGKDWLIAEHLDHMRDPLWAPNGPACQGRER